MYYFDIRQYFLKISTYLVTTSAKVINLCSSNVAVGGLRALELLESRDYIHITKVFLGPALVSFRILSKPVVLKLKP